MDRISISRSASSRTPGTRATGTKTWRRWILGEVFLHFRAALVLRQIPEGLEKCAIRLHLIFNGLPLLLRHLLQRGFHALSHCGIGRRKCIGGIRVFGGARRSPTSGEGFGRMLPMPVYDGVERQEHREQNGQFVSTK
jgi:hypothetical protein